MSKPEINIPTEFAANGTKVDFPNEKILSGFDPINPDILPGDCLNKFIDDTYKGLNGVLELYDTKVNKAGDTMTGDLAIRKSLAHFQAQNTDIRRGQTPLADYYGDTYMLADIDGANIGSLSQIYLANGKHATRLWQRGANSDVYSVLDVGMTENDVPYCNFPNTICCDGQWVNKASTIFEKKSWAVGKTNQSYSLSSYLPNDGHPYEVFVTGNGNTGSSSGSNLTCFIGSAYITNSVLYRCQTRSSSSATSGGSTILPIGTDRKLNVYMEITGAATGNTYLYVEGYRRIGTNA